MGDNTHRMIASHVNGDTGAITVPADVQRERGICIGTTVEVTVHDLPGYIDSASFENEQIAGDRVTIPADFARQVGIEFGREYPVEFEVDVGALGQDRGALDEADDDLSEDDKEALDDLFDEEEESDDMAELFG